MRAVFMLVIVLVVLIVIYQVLLAIDSVLKWQRRQSARSEECPACKQRITVGKDPGSCPECGVNLSRNMQGELMIRLN